VGSQNENPSVPHYLAIVPPPAKASVSETLVPAVKTDSDGRFELRGLGRDRLIALRVSASRAATIFASVLTRPIKSIPLAESRSSNANNSQDQRLRKKPKSCGVKESNQRITTINQYATEVSRRSVSSTRAKPPLWKSRFTATIKVGLASAAAPTCRYERSSSNSNSTNARRAARADWYTFKQALRSLAESRIADILRKDHRRDTFTLYAPNSTTVIDTESALARESQPFSRIVIKSPIYGNCR
jgi:hypothetical protein